MTTAVTQKKAYTPRGRVSFPAIEPSKPMKKMEGNAGGKDKWGATLIFDPAVINSPEFLAMIALARKTLVGKFGDKAKLDTRPNAVKLPDGQPWYLGFKCPFRQNEEKQLEGYTPGGFFVALTTLQPPGCVKADGRTIITHTNPGPDGFYPGCYARATYSCYPYDNSGNKGVAFGAGNFQKLGEGGNFSGREAADRSFDNVEGTDLAVDILPEGDAELLQ